MRVHCGAGPRLWDRACRGHPELGTRGGNAAHLFVVAEPSVAGQPRKAYNLIVTRQFFDRITDHVALRESLVTADVSQQLTRGQGRTAELY